MSEKRDGISDYVRHVQESTQQYTRDVLAENERLGGVVTSLYEEKSRLERAVSTLEERLKQRLRRYLQAALGDAVPTTATANA